MTQRTGTGFGFGTRPSNGETALGTAVEGSAEYVFGPHWSINGYAGWIRGGAVIERLFAGRDLSFIYVENVFQF